MQTYLSDLPRGVSGRESHEHSPPSASWTDPARLLQNTSNKHDGSKLLLGTVGNQLIAIPDDRHAVLCAGSRSGKGRSVIIPNLLEYRGSVLAIDPKAELASITGRWRATSLKQKVYVLDPFNKVAKHMESFKTTFNPLSILKADSPTIIEDAGLIADALIVQSGNDNHWDDSARSIIEGLILHVSLYEKYTKNRTLVTVRDLLMKGSDITHEGDSLSGMDGLHAEMLEHAYMHEDDDLANAIEAAVSDFFDKPDNERGSVLSTARRHTKFLDYKSIRASLVDSDLDLTDLKTKPQGVTVFLCLPASRLGTCRGWFRLFINLALDAMERAAGKPATGMQCLFALDEFATSIGRLQVIENAAGLMAGDPYHVKLWIILQDLGQLEALYKDRWQTFLGNAGIIQFFGNSDLKTLEYIEKRLGKTSMIVSRKSQVTHEQQMKGATGSSWSLEVHDLMNIEEASRYFGRSDIHQRQLVIHGGEAPIILQRINYDQHPHFEGKYDQWGH